MAPRKTGPRTVLRKLPNGVNFEIQSKKLKQTKIVHHNRLSPVRGESRSKVSNSPKVKHPNTNILRSESFLAASTDSDTSDDSVSVDGNTEEESDQDENGAPNVHRYPRRERVARHVEGTIPWSAIDEI